MIKLKYAAIALCVASFYAHADDVDFKLSGFGTLGVSNFSYAHADYTLDTNQKRGPGLSREIDYLLDSKLGVQANASYKSLDFMAQIVGRRQQEKDFTPRIEWLNAKWNISKNAYLRVGRINHPFFMLSDTKLVNYSHIWARPPVNVYGVFPVNTSDGIDGGYRFSIDEVNVNLRAMLGQKARTSTTGENMTRISNLNTLDLSLDWHDWTFRSSYTRAHVSISSQALGGLDTALNHFGMPDVAATYQINNAKAKFYGLGFSYDPGNYVISGEYINAAKLAFFDEARNWYLSGGWRINRFTPYVVFSSSSTKGGYYDSRVAGTPFEPIINSMLLLGVTDNNDLAFGLRWDFAKNMALKTQIDFIKYDKRYNLVNQDSSGKHPGSERLYSLNLDFVF